MNCVKGNVSNASMTFPFVRPTATEPPKRDKVSRFFYRGQWAEHSAGARWCWGPLTYDQGEELHTTAGSHCGRDPWKSVSPAVHTVNEIPEEPPNNTRLYSLLGYQITWIMCFLSTLLKVHTRIIIDIDKPKIPTQRQWFNKVISLMGRLDSNWELQSVTTLSSHGSCLSLPRTIK